MLQSKKPSDNIKKDQYAIVRADKSQEKKSSALQLHDHRPQSALQKKQIEALNSKALQKKTNNSGLPDRLKSGIENLSGHSMDDVKVHYNSDKPAQLNAHAYAQGTDIHLAPGQEKHLPHEAWHVVQQKQGRVKPTMQMKGKVNVNDDAGLEKEADEMGTKALQRKKAEVQMKNGKGKKKKAADKESKAQRSLNNIMAYRGGWCTRNDITLEKMQAFIKTYPNGIRGHASGDSSQGEQGNTTADCLAYKSWHTGIYGWR